ncbi:hypothetical protein OCU04_000005 [Sclerotinia nivalis]|uniref:GST N-terminal domain-containing protein n=1 Tax=Sclerotinia nivalis TaxID=352851 RepID=A0A9X0AVV0_9HELO|nr:hypothetical protein OCU04_000005 [Sclerotinia nivalis]
MIRLQNQNMRNYPRITSTKTCHQTPQLKNNIKANFRYLRRPLDTAHSSFSARSRYSFFIPTPAVMSQPRIKLYWAPGACSLCPHVLLFETDLSFISIAKSITKETVTFTQNFSSINPKMRVPVLSLKDKIITEVLAIATAISSLAFELHLLGRTKMETIRVYEWMNWLSGTLRAHAFGGLLRPERMSDDEGALLLIEKKGLKNV